MIGLANAVGSLGAGWLSTRMPKRYILAFIYFARSAAIIFFILMPPSPATALMFGVFIGLLWLSTVPPTSALVMVMFGTKYMAMLYGFAFFSHQLGGFLGVWLGGLMYESSGSYIGVWWLSVALGVASAIINLPIIEKPVQRARPRRNRRDGRFSSRAYCCWACASSTTCIIARMTRQMQPVPRKAPFSGHPG